MVHDLRAIRPNGSMTYEDAKRLLHQALTATQRRDAIEAALGMGMPLHLIEEYLDWLDANRRTSNNRPKPTRDAGEKPAQN
jgi:hypothetical protein